MRRATSAGVIGSTPARCAQRSIKRATPGAREQDRDIRLSLRRAQESVRRDQIHADPRRHGGEFSEMVGDEPRPEPLGRADPDGAAVALAFRIVLVEAGDGAIDILDTPQQSLARIGQLLAVAMLLKQGLAEILLQSP